MTFKAVILTSAGRNIGEEIPKSVAHEGTRVAVVYIDKGTGGE